MREQITRNRIHRVMEAIENKTSLMIEDIIGLSSKLRQWQDGYLKSSYFLETLNKYYDEVNK